MKILKTGQLVKLRHNRHYWKPSLPQSKVEGGAEHDQFQLVEKKAIRSRMVIGSNPWSSVKTEEYERINPQRLAIILEESEEIDMDLYHKCWVIPHKGSFWDGECWLKREELEVIRPSTFDLRLPEGI
jgi:hypothetical protein